MHINVLLDTNNVYKYSHGGRTPMHQKFTHHFTAGDKIRWESDRRVQIEFPSAKICPFVNADGTDWAGNKAIFPGQAAILNPKFGRDLYYLPIKYTVSLPDSPGVPPHEP